MDGKNFQQIFLDLNFRRLKIVYLQHRHTKMLVIYLFLIRFSTFKFLHKWRLWLINWYQGNWNWYQLNVKSAGNSKFMSLSSLVGYFPPNCLYNSLQTTMMENNFWICFFFYLIRCIFISFVICQVWVGDWSTAIFFFFYIMGLSHPCHLTIHPESSKKTHFIMDSFSESKDSWVYEPFDIHI